MKKKILTKEETLVIEGTDPRYAADTINNLSAYTISNLSADTISKLSADTISNLSAYTINNLSADTISNLSADTISNLSAYTISKLSADTINKLKSFQNSIPQMDSPYSAILAAINKTDCKLDMSNWHTCNTTHCLAGWIVHLTGKPGYDLEKKSGSTKNAATMILRKSCKPDVPLPNFYASNEAAMAFIKARAKEEKPS